MVRARYPTDGIADDPLPDSANAAIASWRAATGRLDGMGRREVGRVGHVVAEIDEAGEVGAAGRPKP